MVQLSEDDIGKKVVNNEGEIVGQLTGFELNSAHIDPDPGLMDSIKSKLGLQHPDEDDIILDINQIESTTDDTVRLR